MTMMASGSDTSIPNASARGPKGETPVITGLFMEDSSEVVNDNEQDDKTQNPIADGSESAEEKEASDGTAAQDTGDGAEGGTSAKVTADVKSVDDGVKEELSSKLSQRGVSLEEQTQLVDAVEKLREAVLADHANEYSRAFDLYKQGLAASISLMKSANGWCNKLKVNFRRKVQQCMTRAESIKEFLDPRRVFDDSEEKPELLASLMIQCRKEFRMECNVKWNDVIGLDNCKERLKEWLILPLKFPQLFKGVRRPHNFGNILLYGLPGCGKTLLVKAVVSEIENCSLLHVTAASLRSKYHGDQEKKVEALFELARLQRPCVLMIDDIEDLCIKDDVCRKVGLSFISQLRSQESNRFLESQVMVLLCSSDPSSLYSDIRRLFPWRLHVPLPDLYTRAGIIENCFKDIAADLMNDDFLEIAARTVGWTGSDLTVLARGAAMVPIREIYITNYFKMVSKSLAEGQPGQDSEEEDYVYIPCAEDEDGAEHLKMSQLSEKDLFIRPINLADLRQETEKTTSSACPDQLKKLKQFQSNFGIEEDDDTKKITGVSSLKDISRDVLLATLKPTFEKEPCSTITGRQYTVIDQLPIPRTLKLYLMVNT